MRTHIHILICMRMDGNEWKKAREEEKEEEKKRAMERQKRSTCQYAFEL